MEPLVLFSFIKYCWGIGLHDVKICSMRYIPGDVNKCWYDFKWITKCFNVFLLWVKCKDVLQMDNFTQPPESVFLLQEYILLRLMHLTTSVVWFMFLMTLPEHSRALLKHVPALNNKSHPTYDWNRELLSKMYLADIYAAQAVLCILGLQLNNIVTMIDFHFIAQE